MGKILLVVYPAIVVMGVLLKFPANEETIRQSLSGGIVLSGILAGIVISFLVAKVFQLKEERTERRLEISQLSKKLTHFRKLLARVTRSYDFWKRYHDIAAFKKRFPEVGYLNRRDAFDPKKLTLEEKDWHESSIMVFLAMEAIIDDEKAIPSWQYDPLFEPSYPLSSIAKYMEPANAIWYYFDHQYASMRDHIHDGAFGPMNKPDINELASSIDPVYREWEVDRILLSELGSKFHQEYLPRLVRLTRLNSEGAPKPLIYIFLILAVVLVFGSCFPLVLQSISIDLNVFRILFVFSTCVLVMSVVALMIQIFELLRTEILV